GPVSPRSVERTLRSVGRIWHLHIDGKIIRTSGEHPFFVHNRGWTEANRLQPGDLLESHDGKKVRVEEVVDTGCLETLYNVHIADHHTYFVSDVDWEFSVWAHNACEIVRPNISGNSTGQFRLGTPNQQGGYDFLTV